ncbi:MAG: 50S ribosomal protein L11 [Thermoplasmata archaeon]
MEIIDLLVEGGKATAGPPLGPALGPLGLNILDVVEAVNERTAAFDGMKVPVRILVDPIGGTFDLEVGTPTTSALLLKAAGLEKGSGNPRTEKVGNLSLGQVVEVARMKADETLGADLKGKTLEVLGSCVSLGVTVEDKEPHDIQVEVKEGLHDGRFKE